MTSTAAKYIDETTGLVIGANVANEDLAALSIADELAAGRPLPSVGDVVVLFSRGRQRAVRVTKIGRTNITGEYASPTAITEGYERAVGYVDRELAGVERRAATNVERIAEYRAELELGDELQPDKYDRRRIRELGAEYASYPTVAAWRAHRREDLERYIRNAEEELAEVLPARRAALEAMTSMSRGELVAEVTTITRKSQPFTHVFRLAGDEEVAG